MEITKIKQAAEIAKSRTSDKRWLNAIDRAVAGVESGWWVVTELADCLAITTECGKTYFANGKCQCKSFEFGQACRHRALYRLYQIANEKCSVEERLPEKCSVEEPFSRESLIADIERAWPATWPPLADELMRRFKRNQLEMLSIDFLTAIRAAIA